MSSIRLQTTVLDKEIDLILSMDSSSRRERMIQHQCRIDNSSKCSNCYEPRGPLCEMCFLLYARVGIRVYSRCPRQTFRKGPCFAYAIQKLHSLIAC